MGLKGLYGPRSAKMSFKLIAGLKGGEVCQHEWWEGRLQVQGGGRHRHSRRCGTGRRTERKKDIRCYSKAMEIVSIAEIEVKNISNSRCGRGSRSVSDKVSHKSLARKPAECKCLLLYCILYCMGCKLRKLSSCGFRKLSQEESGRIMFAHHKELLCQEGVEVLHCDHIQIHWEPARDIWRWSEWGKSIKASVWPHLCSMGTCVIEVKKWMD